MMGNFLSTTTILNNVYSGGTLNGFQSTASVLNAVLVSGATPALGINLIGGGGGSGTSGTSGTSGIDGLSGATGADGTSGIDGTSGTSGVDGVADISGLADTAILYNNAGTVSGSTLARYDASNKNLIIGTTNNPSEDYNIVVGNHTNAGNKYNAIFGQSNSVSTASYTWDNLVAGRNNSLQNENYDNLLVGRGNICNTRYSLIGGYNVAVNGYNNISGGGGIKHNGDYGLAAGGANTLNGDYGFIVGEGNYIAKNNNYLLGQSLTGNTNIHAVIVGYGNETTGIAPDYLDDVMFQVGCGSGGTGAAFSTPSVRRNGLTVKRSMDTIFGGDPIVYDQYDGAAYRIQVSGGTIQAIAV